MTPTWRSKLVGVAAAVFLSTSASGLDLTAGAGPARDCPPSGAAAAFDASAIAYLQPAPVVTVDSYGDGRYDPSPGSNVGLAIGFSELSAADAGFCLGVLYRAEYLARATRDTLDALVANHVGSPFEAGRTYSLELAENSFKTEGLRLRHSWSIYLSDVWSVKIGGAASLLKGTEIEQDELSGAVTATSSTYAVGAGVWQQTGTHFNLSDFNPFVILGHPSGYGFSTDAEIILASAKGASIDVAVLDAVGRLYWHDIPRSERTLENSAIRYNANLNRDALISGIDTQVNVTQTLPTRYHIAYEVPIFADVALDVMDDLVQKMNFTSIGASYGPITRREELSFDFQTRAVSLGGRWDSVSLAVTSNRWDVRAATVLGISIRAFYSW